VSRFTRVLLAVALGLAGIVQPSSTPAAVAATPNLTITTDATYVVQPENGRVRVVVDLEATNHLEDTTTHRYYFDRAYLAVLPGTTGFQLTAESGSPSVRVTERGKTHTMLLLSFGQRIGAGRTAELRLRFDLPDPGGAATRQIRIGSALVSFPVWAFATPSTVGSTVRVIFPSGFNVQQEAGEFPEPTIDDQGRQVFRTAALAEPLEFFAYFSADRPGAYTDVSSTVDVLGKAARLQIRAWPDDPDWAERVGDLFGRGLPVIGEMTGLPWTRTEPLVVQEAVSRSTGGYAGMFDPRTGRAEVAYYADSFVVLHEAAHAWFNGALLADRWANEAFASYYALEAARELGEDVEGQALTDELREARIPLNAWAAVGRESAPTEDFGYAASLELARLVAERAGEPGLRAVWRAAAAREGAWQVAGADDLELVEAAPDWRGLLDLLEDRTGREYADLWRQWVIRPGEAALLDAREAAHREYATVAETAADWALPRPIRDALRAWQFEQAEDLLADARIALERRADVERAAAAVGLEPAPTMELLFESERGFATVGSQADAELRTIEALVAAATTRPAAPDLVQTIGLSDVDPEEELATARRAYGRGDLVGALQSAAAAQEMWLGAAEVGRNRLFVAIGTALLVLLALAYAIAVVRRLRRGRRARHARHARPGQRPGSPGDQVAADSVRAVPYATLPGDSPDPDG